MSSIASDTTLIEQEDKLSPTFFLELNAVVVGSSECFTISIATASFTPDLPPTKGVVAVGHSQSCRSPLCNRDFRILNVIASQSRPTARVVLPVAEDSDPEEDGTLANQSDDEDGDFLAELPDDTDELDLIHQRIGSLESLRLPRFAASLTRLCLRQNHITSLDPNIFNTLIHLTELDLYDNKLKDRGIGPALDQLVELTTLDFSFNLLKHVPGTLAHLPQLSTVYFVQNRIGKIESLDAPTLINLRSLELGGNRIRVIDGLASLVNLEELWLGKNKITKLENLSTLTKLKILSIQSNRITKLEGLEDLVNLEELYISHNGLEKLEGLEQNIKLTTLDVGSNFITTIEGISHLSLLEELWISGNKIATFASLEPELGKLEHLETLYLEHNPCQLTDQTGYRRKVILALPRLKQLDATYIRQV
ncbi:protein phosphatase regulatory subunit [Flagelloscypha sp. PMI_526]|nr:protein phosphatase regulatory subunit [Flagelloscypha sp. PMI_526]